MRSKHTEAFDAHLMLNLAGADELLADVTHVAGAFADPDLGCASGRKGAGDQFRENGNSDVNGGVFGVIVSLFGAPSDGRKPLVRIERQSAPFTQFTNQDAASGDQATGEVRARPELHTTLLLPQGPDYNAAREPH